MLLSIALATLACPSLPAEDVRGVSLRDRTAGPRVVLVSDRAPGRVSELMGFLHQHFDDVRFAACASAPGSDQADVFVVDLAPGGRLDLGDHWLPFRGVSGTGVNQALVLLGESSAMVAAEFGILGAAPAAELPLAPTFTWTGAAPRPGPWTPQAEDERVLPALPSEALADLIPTLARAPRLAPEAEVSVVGTDAQGREVALVWHQGRFVHFLPAAGDPADLPAAWQGLLRDSIDLAAGFERYRSNPPLTPGTPSSVTPEELAQVDSLGALAALVEGLGATALDERLAARRALERALDVSIWQEDSWVPGPGASAVVWRAFFAEYGEYLLLDPLHGNWHVDYQAYWLERPATELSPVERATAGYFPRDTTQPRVEGPAELRAALLAATEDCVHVAPEGETYEERELRVAQHVAHLARNAGVLARLAPLDLADATELARHATSGAMASTESVPILATAIARTGPASFDALLHLAALDRPFSPSLAEQLAKRAKQQTDMVWLIPGELSHAFRAMAWHRDADSTFFASCLHQLDVALEAAAAEGSALGEARRRPIALVFELGAALQVGLERGLLDEAQLAQLVELVAAANEQVPSQVHGFLFELLTDVDPIAALGHSLGAWGRWLDGRSADSNSFYYGPPGPGRYGRPGLRVGLEQLSELPVPVRRNWVSELASTAVNQPELVTELLADPATLHLGQRAIGLVGVSPMLCGLLDEVEGSGLALTPEAQRWLRRDLAFGLGSPYVDHRPATDQLLAMLADPDPWLRAFACSALREPRGGQDEAVVARLTELAAGDDPVLSALAADAIVHGSEPTGWRVRAIRAHPQRDEIVDPIFLDDEGDWSGLEHEEPLERQRTAWYLAASQGEELLAGLAAGDRLATERVGRIEEQLRVWIDELCVKMDDEFGVGPATSLLGRFGPVALPELENELMRPYRFPIGSASYTELCSAIDGLGMEAWPIYLVSVHHWRGHGFGDVRTDLWSGGDALPSWTQREAAILAPFLALRFARDATLMPMNESFRVEPGGKPSPVYVKVWKNLGDAGEAALVELGGHPDPVVRKAVEELRDRL